MDVDEQAKVKFSLCVTKYHAMKKYESRGLNLLLPVGTL
jgi:hypothetical protein